MRKIIAVSIVGLSLAMSAGAQTPTSTSQMREEMSAYGRSPEGRQTQIEERRAELQTRLQSIRDERKKQAVERIHTAVNALNERMTGHFINVLDQIDKVLDRVESRTDKAEANGLDVSTVRPEITNAENAIAAARAAVEAQAGKVYEVQITGSETTLRADVGKTRQELHEDLTGVRDLVKAAREAVRNAAVTLAQIPRVNDNE